VIAPAAGSNLQSIACLVKDAAKHHELQQKAQECYQKRVLPEKILLLCLHDFGDFLDGIPVHKMA
jgi:hypothetical protein